MMFYLNLYLTCDKILSRSSITIFPFKLVHRIRPFSIDSFGIASSYTVLYAVINCLASSLGNENSTNL